MRKTFCRLVLAGLLASGNSFTDADGSLYARIGGAPVMARVVDRMMELNQANPQTNRSFRKINLKRLRQQLNEQLCALTDGPCQYSGDDMKTIHAGLDITEAEFNGLVEHLVIALDDNRVGLAEKNELLRRLAPMKRDVVSR